MANKTVRALADVFMWTEDGVLHSAVQDKTHRSILKGETVTIDGTLADAAILAGQVEEVV